MENLLFFLLGYPLGILSDLSSSLILDRFKSSDTIPLKALFIKAFKASLEENKSKVDKIGKEAIKNVQIELEKDEEKLFHIINESLVKILKSTNSSRTKNLKMI